MITEPNDHPSSMRNEIVVELKSTRTHGIDGLELFMKN